MCGVNKKSLLSVHGRGGCGSRGSRGLGVEGVEGVLEYTLQGMEGLP